MSAFVRHWELWLALIILGGLAVATKPKPRVEPSKFERDAAPVIMADPDRPQMRRLAEAEGIVILHDDRRFVTCYVAHDDGLHRIPGGIACLPDVDIGELRQ